MRKRIIFLFTCALGLLLLTAPAALAFGVNITSIDPTSARANSTAGFTVYGSFGTTPLVDQVPQFQLIQGGTTITGTTTSYVASKASVTFALPGSTPLGAYDVRVTQVHNLLTYWNLLPGAFTVLAPAPIISSTNPTSVVAGSSDLTLTVYGSYFTSGGGLLHLPSARVYFNGAACATTFNSTTVLTAVVPASALTVPGMAAVIVLNPGFFVSSDAWSNSYPLTITVPTPTLSSLSPSSAVVGGASFDMGVTGTNFMTGSSHAVVRWNGVDLVTTPDSATHLTAAVPASLIAAAGSATITVRNGTDLSAPVSNALSFSIGNVVPTVVSVSPTSVWAGYVKDDITLLVNGTDFLSGAHVMLGTTEKGTTSFVSVTQLSVPLLAADIASPGTISVGVKNPAPGGGTSATTQPLAVVAETSDPIIGITGADSAWHNSPVTLAFAGSDSQSGVQSVQYRCPPAVSSWTTGATYTVPVTTQGTLTVYAQATDWCNRVGSASATVKIDTTDPATDALNAVRVKRNKNATLRFRITEPADLSPRAQVVLKVKAVKGGKVVKTKTLSGVAMNAQQSYSFKVTFKKGAYKWYVYATDLAGNPQANIDTAAFTVK